MTEHIFGVDTVRASRFMNLPPQVLLPSPKVEVYIYIYIYIYCTLFQRVNIKFNATYFGIYNSSNALV